MDGRKRRRTHQEDEKAARGRGGAGEVGRPRKEEGMDAEGLRRTLLHIKKVGCQLPNIDPERLVVDQEGKLGEGEARAASGGDERPQTEGLTRRENEGGYSVAFQARLDGEKEVCAKLVQETKPKEVVKELKTVDIDGVTLPQYGYSYCEGKDKRYYVCVVNQFCEHADLFTFLQMEKVLMLAKVDVMCQCLRGLVELKKQRVVWRDLKGHNMLVKSVERDGRGHVTKVKVLLNDWGTAAFLPEDGERRMTLHGPGTIGFIAPDTRTCTYSYQADMWAFNVWAATMCLPPDMVPENESNPPLDWRLEDLQLQKKFTAYHKQEAQVKQILSEVEDQVLPDCWRLWKALTSRPWVDPNKRWSCEEALRELESFLAAESGPLQPLRTRNGRRRLIVAKAAPPSPEEPLCTPPTCADKGKMPPDHVEDVVPETPSSRRASVIAPEDMRMMQEQRKVKPKGRVVRKLSVLAEDDGKNEDEEKDVEEEPVDDVMCTPVGRRKTRAASRLRESMEVLLGLGFGRKEAEEALAVKDGNLEKALDVLFV